MTNLEGRVIRRRRALEPPAGVKTDIEILCAVGAALGKRQHFTFGAPREVFEELRKASAGGPADYSGISYERLDAPADADGLFWPCPAVDHPGTPRLFAESFPTPDGRARFHAVSHQSPVDDRDDDHPLYLTTGRLLAHYQSGTQTRRVTELQEAAGEPVVEMHPATARRHALADGGRVALTTRRGTGTFMLRLTPAIREDTVFLPFHWGGEQSANRLTSAALDPTSEMPEFKVCAVRADIGAEPDEGGKPDPTSPAAA